MSSPDIDAPAAADEVEAPADERRDAQVALLSEILGDSLVESHVEPGLDMWIRVRADAWVDAGLALRDKCDMAYFGFLSAIDWMPSPYGRDMDAAVDVVPEAVDDRAGSPRTDRYETGLAGGETRFQILARVHDPTNHVGVTVKADLAGDAPELDSWIPVYPGANWHEREVWEMFGITFRGHPNQVHLYLPSHFEGNPLRKDYPLLARRVKPWPGIVDVELMPGEDAADGVDEGDVS